MPKISICIPAFKQPDYLKRLLDSIIEQTYKDYEIVITDDTLDNSIENVVKRYDSKKIIYRKNEIALGSPRNWNESLKHARGDYIKIMHHDDWFTDVDSLSKFAKMLDENPSCDFAFSGSLNIGDSKKWIHYITNEKVVEIKRNPNYLFLGNFIGAPSATIYRRNTMIFDSHLKWLVDLEFYIRLLLINNNFIYTTDPIVSIGISDTQVTNECQSNKDLENYEYLYIYNKFNLKKNKKIRKYLFNLLISNSADFSLFEKEKYLYFEYIVRKPLYKCRRLLNIIKRVLK